MAARPFFRPVLYPAERLFTHRKPEPENPVWPGGPGAFEPAALSDFFNYFDLAGDGYFSFCWLPGAACLSPGGYREAGGAGLGPGAVMEIPLMYLGSRWFARYSYSRLILFSLGGFALVWASGSPRPFSGADYGRLTGYGDLLWNFLGGSSGLCQ